VYAHVNSVEDQEFLRAAVTASGLVAFVRNGAVLPRDSGDSDLVRVLA
jgi:predicted ABC-class ATPase